MFGKPPSTGVSPGCAPAGVPEAGVAVPPACHGASVPGCAVAGCAATPASNALLVDEDQNLAAVGPAGKHGRHSETADARRVGGRRHRHDAEANEQYGVGRPAERSCNRN